MKIYRLSAGKLLVCGGIPNPVSAGHGGRVRVVIKWELGLVNRGNYGKIVRLPLATFVEVALTPPAADRDSKRSFHQTQDL